MRIGCKCFQCDIYSIWTSKSPVPLREPVQVSILASSILLVPVVHSTVQQQHYHLVTGTEEPMCCELCELHTNKLPEGAVVMACCYGLWLWPVVLWKWLQGLDMIFLTCDKRWNHVALLRNCRSTNCGAQQMMLRLCQRSWEPVGAVQTRCLVQQVYSRAVP